MRTRGHCVVLAVAMVMGCGIGVGTAYGADKGSGTEQPALPPGTKAVDQPKKGSMTETLAEVSNAAFSKGSFDDVVDHFVDQDRDRMRAEHKDYADVKSLAQDLNKAFKDKYGKEFSLQDNDVKSQAFAKAAVAEGEINDPAKLMKSWPVDPTPNRSGNEAQPAAKSLQPGSDEATSNANIERGREVGVVRLPGQEKLPALDVSMIDEAGGWKIDVPNNRTGQMVHDDLVKQLQALKDNQGQWPQDVNDAYRMITHHVVMGIYGVDGSQEAKG